MFSQIWWLRCRAFRVCRLSAADAADILPPRLKMSRDFGPMRFGDRSSWMSFSVEPPKLWKLLDIDEYPDDDDVIDVLDRCVSRSDVDVDDRMEATSVLQHRSLQETPELRDFRVYRKRKMPQLMQLCHPLLRDSSQIFSFLYDWKCRPHLHHFC